MSVSPLADSEGPVFVSVSVNGTLLPETVEIIATRTRAEIGRVPKAVLVFSDGDLAEQSFELTDGPTFVPGATVEVKAGYGDAPGRLIFTGLVTGLRQRLGGAGQRLELEVTCRHPAIVAATQPRDAFFQQKTDGEVIASILEDAGLTATVGATSPEMAHTIQHACTDWAFVGLLAARNGLDVVAEASGQVTVRASDMAAAAALRVTLGEDLIAFDAEVDATDQIAAASLSARAADGPTVNTASGQAPTVTTLGNLTADALAAAVGAPTRTAAVSGVVDEAALTAQASADRRRAALAAVRGSVRFQGSALAAPGTIIELAGVAARFSGKAFVSGIRHVIEAGDWTTEAILGVEPASAAPVPAPGGHAAAGRTAPVVGQQIATVTAVATGDDPTMVEVNLPFLGDQTKIYARQAAPYAGAGTGLMLLPEVGDEVVVGFFDGSPDHPVILGSLWSGQRAMPAAPDEDNTVKTLVSRAQLAVSFDEAAKSITLATPGGNSLVLSDQDGGLTLADQNGNTVKLSSAGVAIDSTSAVSVSAATDLTASATSGVTVSGLDVSLSADAGLTATGTASAELSASGTVTVRGTLVQIN